MAMVTTRANVSKPIWQPQPGPLSTPWTGQVGPDNALSEYPRPQLSRHRWLNLNGLWDYAGLPGTATAVPSEVRYGERILVPYPQESALSGIHRHDDQMFYRRDFEVPQDWRGQRVLLHFGAVDQVAVRSRSSCAPRICCDLAPFPVGKQRGAPGGIFYTGSSGIWQTVWLEPVAAAHVDKLDITPSLAGFTVVPRFPGLPASGLSWWWRSAAPRLPARSARPGARVRIPNRYLKCE
jgi:hypothetical protein